MHSQGQFAQPHVVRTAAVVTYIARCSVGVPNLPRGVRLGTSRAGSSPTREKLEPALKNDEPARAQAYRGGTGATS